VYVTPARYRTMGYGADIDELDDAQLAMQLRLASSLVNRYCNLPVGYDFRGGLVTNEKHPWVIGNGNVPGQMSVFPKLPPVTEVLSFRIQVTNTQYLEVDKNYVQVAPGGALTPVIAATSIGVWSYSAIPVAGYPVPEARVSYSYGYFHTDEGEELFPEGGGLYRAANQWWTDDEVVVAKNGTPLTLGTDYSVNSDEGTVTLTETQAEAMDLDDVITVTYTHRVPENVRDATAVITTDMLGAKAIVGAGLQGLSAIRAEEIELRTDSRSTVTTGDISPRARLLLASYRRLHWG
jgi:hypothetical protein